MSTAAGLPAPPWLCSHIGLDLAGADDLSAIHDSDGRLIAIVQHGPSQVGDLMALAPELLRELRALASAAQQLDPDYCRKHRIRFNPDALAESLSQALATLEHAHDMGLCSEVPQ